MCQLRSGDCNTSYQAKQCTTQWAARHSRFSKCPATLLKYSLSIWRLITSQLCQCKGIKRSDSASKPNVRPDWEVLRLRQQVRQNALVCHFDAHEYNMDYSLYSFCDWSQACFIFSSGNSNFQSYLILFLCGRLSHRSDSAAVRSFSKIPIVRERANRELRERCPVVSCLPQSGSTPSHLLRSPLSASSLSLLRLLPSSSSPQCLPLHRLLPTLLSPHRSTQPPAAHRPTVQCPGKAQRAKWEKLGEGESGRPHDLRFDNSGARNLVPLVR